MTIRHLFRYYRPLDSRTRTTASTRFDLKFFRVFSNDKHPGKLHCTSFSPEFNTVIFTEGAFKLKSHLPAAK